MKHYKTILAKFLSWKHGENYNADTEFSQDQLLSIFPEDIVKYFNLRAYGAEEPDDTASPRNYSEFSVFVFLVFA